jgi:DNA-directed RNA polymerase subunit E'/Rpb7
VKQKLREEVEGTVNGRYGFIVTIISIDPIPLGQIEEGFHK